LMLDSSKSCLEIAKRFAREMSERNPFGIWTGDADRRKIRTISLRRSRFARQKRTFR
jgi:hypothetical protein